LARAIEQHAARAGDYFTAIPALSLHRRDAPTEPVHCVYGPWVGAITTQGGKQVLLGVCQPGGRDGIACQRSTPVIASEASASTPIIEPVVVRI
jgi:hypothetical protein